MKTHQIRKALGKKFTQQYFCQTYQIPLATIKNWDSRGSAPSWLRWIFADLIHYRELAKEYRDKYYEAVAAGVDDEEARKKLRSDVVFEYSCRDQEIFDGVMDYIEGKPSSYEP